MNFELNGNSLNIVDGFNYEIHYNNVWNNEFCMNSFTRCAIKMTVDRSRSIFVDKSEIFAIVSFIFFLFHEILMIDWLRFILIYTISSPIFSGVFDNQ